MALPQTPLSRRQFIGIASAAAASLLAACGGSRTVPSASVASATVAPSVVAPPLPTPSAATATAPPSAVALPSTVAAPAAPAASTTPSATPSTALPPPELDAWLRANATSFATTDPTAAVADLAPFRTIIGDARIVALGEDTHGTHEFQVMKHRLLHFLVTQMGFTLFALEANWPEANRLNDYVHGGTGDPTALIKALRSWPVETQEVLQLPHDEQTCLQDAISVRQIQNLALAHTGPAGQCAALLRVARIDLQHLCVQLVDQTRPLRHEIVAMVTQ